MGTSFYTPGTDWEMGVFSVFGIRQLHGPVFSGIRSERIKGFSFPMFKSFRSEKSAELFHHQPGLEYWFKGKRRASVYQSQRASGGIGAANEWYALKTALYWDSLDLRAKADNDQNTWKICR